MRRVLIGAVVMLTLTGCAEELLDGSQVFSCAVDEQCLVGFRCFGSVCTPACSSDGSCASGQSCEAVPGRGFSVCQVSGGGCTQAGESCQSGAECCSRDCQGGTCAEGCAPPGMMCGSSCVDTETSALHCGACEMPCGPEERCEGGTCVPDDTSCLVDGASCGSDPEGCCANTVCDGSICVEIPPEDMRPCNGQTFACGNGGDDDGDGLVDALDPGCSSACDNDESSLAPVGPGAGAQCMRTDCFWDSEGGSANDGCVWHMGCDPLERLEGCTNPRSGDCDEQSQMCKDVCGALTPNGCDCFGCCEIEGQSYFMGSADCALDNLESCRPCTMVETCAIPCDEECELCVGQTLSDLPDSCNEEPTCSRGPSCKTHGDCGATESCLTGCCLALPAE